MMDNIEAGRPDSDLIQVTAHGLYCPPGDFFVDPWRAVPRALITHAHSDHARAGCDAYLCSASGKAVLRQRIGKAAPIEGLPFGETRQIGETRVSLHPAGHILGSAQVRIEHQGQVWVVSGDYKTVADPSCEPFEPVKCDCFISECTFGLPLYRWPDPAKVLAEILDWWQTNQSEGRISIIFAYPLGKSQRLLAALADPCTPPGPIGLYGNAGVFCQLYRKAGRPQAPARILTAETISTFRNSGGLLIAPAMLQNARPLRKLGEISTAFASGWMRLRGPRRRLAVDRGFVLSDHADWPGLIEAIRATGAPRIGLTHGQTAPLQRYLNEEMKLQAFALPTRFVGESIESDQATPKNNPSDLLPQPASNPLDD